MREETENWWKQANRDFRSAKRIMELGEYYVNAFLSQQAVEKALKALLIDRTGNFPRIHDIAELSRRVKAPLKITEEILNSSLEILEWTKKELKL